MSEKKFTIQTLSSRPTNQASLVLDYLVSEAGLLVVRNSETGKFAVTDNSSGEVVAGEYEKMAQGFAAAVKLAIQRLAQKPIVKALNEYTDN